MKQPLVLLFLIVGIIVVIMRSLRNDDTANNSMAKVNDNPPPKPDQHRNTPDYSNAPPLRVRVVDSLYPEQEVQKQKPAVKQVPIRPNLTKAQPAVPPVPLIPPVPPVPPVPAQSTISPSISTMDPEERRRIFERVSKVVTVPEEILIDPTVDKETVAKRSPFRQQVARIATRVIDSPENVVVHHTVHAFHSSVLKDLQRRIKGNLIVLTQHGDVAYYHRCETISDFFVIPNTSAPASHTAARPQLRPLLDSITTFIIIAAEDLSPATFEAMDWRLRKTLDIDAPFGGKRVILLGDLYGCHRSLADDIQATLVSRYSGTQFFDSPSFAAGDFEIMMADAGAVESHGVDEQLINRIGKLDAGAGDIVSLNRSCARMQSDGTVIYVDTSDEIALNTSRLEALDSEKFLYTAQTDHEINSAFEFPAPHQLELCLGVRVILMADDESGNWHRGMIGVVKDCKPDSIHVDLANGRSAVIHRHTWTRATWSYDNVRKEAVLISCKQFTQFPLAYGWAVSIPNLKYMRINTALVDFSTIHPRFPGQLYQLLHSVRSLKDLSFITPFVLSDLVEGNLLSVIPNDDASEES